MTTVVDELQKLLAGPATLTTDEAVAVAMAIALLKAQAAQPAQPEGWKLVPIKPSAEQLHSMAVRYDHGLGMDGYYDGVWVQQTGVTHAMKLDSTKRTMNQLYEEAIGEGFYKIPAAPSTKEKTE